MARPANDYIPISVRARLRRRAVIVWAAGSALVTFWLLLIAAPAFASGAVGVAIYRFFSYFCHQLPERSFQLAGAQLAVCARCFGIYAGIASGFLTYPLWRQIDETYALPRIWLLLSLIPMGIDWSLTFFGIWENTLASRFLTGGLLGFVCAIYIIPALVELAIAHFGRQKKAAV